MNYLFVALQIILWAGVAAALLVVAFLVADHNVAEFNRSILMKNKPPKYQKPKLIVVDRNFKPPTPMPPSRPVMSSEERQRAALKAILGITGMALGEIEEPDQFDIVLNRIAEMARAGLVTPPEKSK